MDVRRVVTGHDAGGKAVFASDSRVAPTLGTFHLLWGADERPRFPDDGSEPPHRLFFPPLEGFRFLFFTVPPTGAPPPEGVDLSTIDDVVPGLLAYNEPDEPGMHTTPTVDFEVVVSGRVVLELDDGAQVELGPGDTVVQNGTRHRWSNPGTEPAVLAALLIGAHHDRVPYS
jgi:mannose-6-phosphate isomerase-like protein (cupin superfamily)